jgi:hypothetical protein
MLEIIDYFDQLGFLIITPLMPVIFVADSGLRILTSNRDGNGVGGLAAEAGKRMGHVFHGELDGDAWRSAKL